jgi:hypothetical protein
LGKETKEFVKKRVIILTGAGLTASGIFFNITTFGLTKDFVSYQHPDLTQDKELLNFIYSEFCFWNNLDPLKIKENLYQINFETILQIIEELFAYIEDHEKTNHKIKYQNSVKGTVYSLNRRLIYRINQVRIPKWKDGIYIFIEKLYNHLIDEIIRQLVPYNNDGGNSGMNEFKDFLGANFEPSKFISRIYTLNYDNWLNKFGNYFDGFANDEFGSNEVITNRNINCHYNLHGCILWQRHEICRKLVEPEIRKNFQSFDGYTISRDALLPSPIISGYNKLTRINSSPLLEIFHSLTSDCVSANMLLIIGYSFSDPHVNNNLKFIGSDVRIIIVVFLDKSYLADMNSDFYRLTWELKDIFGIEFTNPKIRAGLNFTVDSDDGRVSIFLNGVGSSFYEEYPKM